MLCHRILPLVIVGSFAVCGVAQSAPKVAIPEFPGSTSSTPVQSPSATLPQQPVTSAAPSAPETHPQAPEQPETIQSTTPEKMEGAAIAKPARPLTKAEQKAARKRQKEAEKEAKEAEEDKKFLKMQGGDLVAPTLDANGNPIHLAPCSKKDKTCRKKRKSLLKRKTVGMKIENGTLTVDGWTGKARLNYDISELKFLYVWSPGIGTTVISNQNFPGAKEEKDAVKGNTLTVTTADNHEIQLTSENPLMGKSKKSLSMWVATDSEYNLPARYPAFGYGSTAKAPYNWPGSLPMSEKERKLTAHAPPLPKGMEAKQLELPCVNVRPGEEIKPVKLNGYTYTPKPCAAKPQVTEALSTNGERPPDGAGAASTGVADPAAQRK